MSKPQTIREAVTYLYGALDIARRPGSWVAGALALIETETERQAAALAAADARCTDELTEMNQDLTRIVTEAESRSARLRAFAEEMAWYAPQEDWEDAARRLLNYGDCRRYVEIVPDDSAEGE
jgi:hypothetical protein